MLKSGPTDSALLLTRQLLNRAIHDSLPYFQAKAELYLGEYFLRGGIYDSSMAYLDKAGKYFSDNSNEKDLARTLFLKSLIFKSWDQQTR
ncbi:MAG: hypothetical protein Kow00127_16760 [Bacteroidales bacterium]